MTKLWLDDLREPPDDTWLRAKTRDEAIVILKNEDVEFASLDYDIQWDPGGNEYDYENTRTGMAVVLWMSNMEKWPQKGVAVHSSNKEGALKMILALGEHYKKEQA